MRTGISNVTPEEFARRFVELSNEQEQLRLGDKLHVPRPVALLEMIAEFDRLMETGDLDTETHPADKLGEKIMCSRTWRAKQPCGKNGQPKQPAAPATTSTTAALLSGASSSTPTLGVATARPDAEKPVGE